MVFLGREFQSAIFCPAVASWPLASATDRPQLFQGLTPAFMAASGFNLSMPIEHLPAVSRLQAPCSTARPEATKPPRAAHPSDAPPLRFRVTTAERAGCGGPRGAPRAQPAAGGGALPGTAPRRGPAGPAVGPPGRGRPRGAAQPGPASSAAPPAMVGKAKRPRLHRAAPRPWPARDPPPLPGPGPGSWGSAAGKDWDLSSSGVFSGLKIDPDTLVKKLDLDSRSIISSRTGCLSQAVPHHNTFQMERGAALTLTVPDDLVRAVSVSVLQQAVIKLHCV
ncbi:ribosome biogenesis protein SLX9 homolog isoform X2 [Falco biarmicus]|uniref:ribosome biogenesis protein SLX9 homolog isoform X2 n=1 Tax=Falco biarmicus TaxID=345155 RepID=UPI0024BC457E|nr:ribosome biogenesis protein SLX9 homolog isoform X2 [Falco biarmicus]